MSVDQSQFHTRPQAVPEPSGDGGTGGGFLGHLRKHWVEYTLGIGGASLVIMFLLYRQSQSGAAQQAAANTAIDPTTGQPYNVQSPNVDGSWGSQLDADYQQLTSVETTNTGLLQNILNTLQTPPISTTTTTTAPFKYPNSAWQQNPLLPQGTNITNPMEGEQFTFEGTVGQLVPGGGSRVWWVPEVGGKKLTNTQLNAVPIGTGTGQKELLSAPSSFYHP